jgi:peptide/nickel transport system ATP-binding protein
MAKNKALQPVLVLEDLTIAYQSGGRLAIAVDSLSFAVDEGEIIGICGESGSGKSTALLAASGLFRSSARHLRGRVLFDGRDLLALSAKEMRALRGRDIGVILQDPARCLDPLFDIGSHFVETARAHGVRSPKRARQEAINLLNRFHVSAPETRLAQYSFQMSGGMLQRIMLALSVFHRPKLLLADEPTTALDVTTQAGILQELARLRDEHGTAIVLVSHDLSVLNVLADRVMIMYAGRCVEYGGRKRVLGDPKHPYTRGLLASIPRLHGTQDQNMEPLAIPGSPPDLAKLPGGCAFWPRCPFAMGICREHTPAFVSVGVNHAAACYLHSGENQCSSHC